MIKYYSYPELSPSINLKRFFEKDVQTVILISFIEMVVKNEYLWLFKVIYF